MWVSSVRGRLAERQTGDSSSITLRLSNRRARCSTARTTAARSRHARRRNLSTVAGGELGVAGGPRGRSVAEGMRHPLSQLGPNPRGGGGTCREGGEWEQIAVQHVRTEASQISATCDRSRTTPARTPLKRVPGCLPPVFDLPSESPRILTLPGQRVRGASRGCATACAHPWHSAM